MVPSEGIVRRLSGKVNRGDLLALVTQLPADREPCRAIGKLLGGCQFLGARSSGSGTGAAGQLTVALLRVGMAMAVHAVNAGQHALVLETPQLTDVLEARRDET